MRMLTFVAVVLLTCSVLFMCRWTKRPQIPRLAIAPVIAIPRVINITWTSADFIESFAEFSTVRFGAKALRDLNPNYTLRVHTDEDVLHRLQSRLSPADWLLLHTRPFATKCDIWRLLVMIEDGGVYSDIDRRWSVSFDECLRAVPSTVRCILPIHSALDFSQDIMMACPGHPIHRRALRLALQRLREGQRTIMIGPGAYFDAACEDLLGPGVIPLHNRKTQPPWVWQKISEAVKTRPDIYTFQEDHRRGPTFGWRHGPPPNIDKEAFYKACDVLHWTKRQKT